MNPDRFAKLKAVLDRRQADLAVVTDQVHKPHNLAAILRTCDAVGIPFVHAVSATGSLNIAHETSAGSRKWVETTLHPTIEAVYAQLRARDFRIVAAHFDETAEDFRAVDFTRPTAVVLGAELDGVSAGAVTAADARVYIPMAGMVQSLNVSVAAATLLFEAQRQRQAAGCYDQVRLDPATYHRLLFEWAWPEVAAVYRRRGWAYPSLGPDGEIRREPSPAD